MDLREEIEKVAYELFERYGKEHGKDREHWLQAESIVKARHAESGQKTGAPRTAKPAAPKAPAAKKASGARKTERKARTPK
jgi:hypothetical protein